MNTGQISVTVAGLLVSIFGKCTCSFREAQWNSHGWNVWCLALASKQPSMWRRRVEVSMKQDQSWADNYWSIWGLIFLLSTLTDIYLLFSIIRHWNSSWGHINILTHKKWPERLNCYHRLFNPWNPCLWSQQCLTLHCGSRTRFLIRQCIRLSIYLWFHLYRKDEMDPPRYVFPHGVWMCIYLSFKLYVLPLTHPH